jgi:hypothetical protein
MDRQVIEHGAYGQMELIDLDFIHITAAHIADMDVNKKQSIAFKSTRIGCFFV